MAITRSKAIGRREGGTFVALPSVVLNSENFKTLKPYSMVLFNCLLSQLKYGKDGTRNNGDLCASFSIAKEWGFGSKSTLSKAIKELLERGWIERTRQVQYRIADGNKPNLYAITIWAVDSCDGKVKATKSPSSLWKKWVPKQE